MAEDLHKKEEQVTLDTKVVCKTMKDHGELENSRIQIPHSLAASISPPGLSRVHTGKRCVLGGESLANFALNLVFLVMGCTALLCAESTLQLTGLHVQV